MNPIKKDNYFLAFDVGQGDSSLFYINNIVTLIDTGGIKNYYAQENNFNIAKNKILPYLKSQGIRKIDNLILTHGDADHMLDSIYIINNFNVKSIYINTNEINDLENEVLFLANKKNISVKQLNKNDQIDIGKYKLISLNKNRDDENNSSIVLYTKINNYSILLTGDIGKNIEIEIINEYNLKNLHILKLAHHGSKTSNDIKFLEYTNSKNIYISVGKNNKFGHPNKEVLNDLNSLQLNYLKTSEVGSIKYNLTNGTILTYPP